jgi:Zn-dependent protease
MDVNKRSRWSWSLGSAFGIDIRIHLTLVAFLVWVGVAAPFRGGPAEQAIAQWLLTVAIFACIVVHELAHALMGRRYGCSTREILLLPIGGIAQMERIPERPAHELLVAIVGPLTNIGIALLLGLVIGLAGWPFDPEQPSVVGAFLVPLFWSNVALAAFNLLPAFPMDGGRVLRSALAIRIDRTRATHIASTVGKALAVVFVVGGLLFGGTMLALIGLFVWFSASHESATVSLAAALRMRRSPMPWCVHPRSSMPRT